MTRFPSAEGWAALEAELAKLPAGDRALVADGWAFAAQQEHASIASFSKFSLELMAVGAPPDFLKRAHQAALDEIDHARMSFRVASLSAGQPLGPGPLPVSLHSLQTMTLQDSAVAAALDGCLNETIAALEAGTAGELARPAALRLVLEEIARDEQAHAELAWEYVAWAISIGGPAVREAVERAVDAALHSLGAAGEQPAAGDVSAWGLLTRRARAELRAHSGREALRPAFAQLLRR